MYNLNHIIKKITGAGKALLLVTLLFATGTVWAQNTQTSERPYCGYRREFLLPEAVVNVARKKLIVL